MPVYKVKQLYYYDEFTANGYIPALNHDFVEFFGQSRRGRETVALVNHFDHLKRI